MEVLLIFVRYAQALVLAFLGLCGFSLFNYLAVRYLFLNSRLETYEVVMNALFRFGPIAFALFFVVFYYGNEWLRMWEDEVFFEKAVFFTSLLMLIVYFVINFFALKQS